MPTRFGASQLKFPLAIAALGGTPRSLHAYTTATLRYMTLETPVGTDYVVPAGKTFKITRVVFSAPVAASVNVSIGYADDGVADGLAAPTNPVYVIGDGSVSVLAMAAILTIYTVDVYAVIPAGKYPFIRGITSAAVVQVHGIEE